MEKDSYRQLTILTEIAGGRHVTQRGMAEKMGIAVGLVNLYLKRLIRKGYIKISTIPANRIKYLLTPKGISEKARLTYEYMDYSLQLYRQTRNTIRNGLESIIDKEIRQVAIYGTTEAAELAFLTLQELGLKVSVVISEDGKSGNFFGIKVYPLSEISFENLDVILVASFITKYNVISSEIAKQGFPKERILNIYQ